MAERIDPALLISQALERTASVQVRKPQPSSSEAAPGSFRNVLEKTLETGSLKFSKHAAERLAGAERQIRPDQIQELERACAKAEAKGARSTLVLMPGLAFVVAPQSRTVITVIPEERLKENVFTSIDSAVIVQK
ncbi:MAG: flagellar protein [Firmicutes bacterium]|nr:flagellar protein [Candidatus Fermentithermobacillaceae bacterium]